MFANANIEVAISVVAVCAISLIVPSKYWTVKYICSDVGLFFFAIIAYAVLTRFRARPKDKQNCKEECEPSASRSSADAAGLQLSPRVEVETVPVQASPAEPKFDVADNIAVMQKYASGRNIAATVRTFRSIKQSGVGMTSIMYNIVLQAWINCGNVQAAEDWMEEMLEAGMADETSYQMLIKVLVSSRAVDKARDLFKNMSRGSVRPNVAICNNLLNGFARDNRLNDGLSLLEEMHVEKLQPSSDTLNLIVKLTNESRNIDQRYARVRNVLSRYNLEVQAPSPRLAAVLAQAEGVKAAPCAHEVQITGSLAQIKAVRKTLKQHGFLDNDEAGCSPLDGHWETDHGLTVIIENKIVRWSAQRASKLRFTTEDRSACTLTLYGEATNGRLVAPAMNPDATKSIIWDNGDIWQSYDGRIIGQDMFHGQTMTKTLRDHKQDESYRARSNALLKCVSKQALGVPSILEETISQFLGNDLYYVRVQFQSKWNPTKKVQPFDDDDDFDMPPVEAEEDTCHAISRRHPRIGIRHCWAEKDANICGQRTLVNGEEVDEDCFSRHVRAVSWA